MPETIFSDAPDVANLTRAILNQEAEFVHLQDQHFVCLFCDRALKRGDQIQYGATEIVSGKNAHCYWTAKGNKQARPFVRITLHQEFWDDLNGEEKAWVIRHQLRHCSLKRGKNGTKLKLRVHEIELFLSDLKDPVMPAVCDVIATLRSSQAAFAFNPSEE
jgi:hypothetical protein